ncbi:DNA polymerase 1, putative, partial [Hepatocystis sp. ex Piliocolobus tephrosceles]
DASKNDASKNDTSKNGEKINLLMPNAEICPTSKEKKNKFITFDYRQMELFVMAYLSFDVHLLKLLSYNDVFIETGKILFHTNEVTNDLRRITKTVLYGILYGQTENGLAKSLLISDKLAKNLIDSFFQHFPNVFKFMQMQKYLVKNINSVYTLIGRKRNIDSTIKNKYRIGMNTPIQGCAADIMKFALLSCSTILSYFDTNPNKNYKLLHVNNIDLNKINKNKDFLNATKLILQVHDELLFETEQTATTPIIQLFTPILENAFYNLIQYTNTTDRLLLLYNYMHDHISIKTYIDELKIINMEHITLDDNYNSSSHNLLRSGMHNFNKETIDKIIFKNFSFILPVKAEMGYHYKECS